jgi:hypothetical protein
MMTLADERIVELSRAARGLLAGPPDFLRTLVGDESEGRLQRRAVVVAALREHEARGMVGISLDELAADVEAVLRLRDDAIPDDLRTECIDILRQLEGWDVVDSAVAPERARMDGGMRRRVERDYSLARPMRIFLPHWDEIQRQLRRRYISLSANYFAQAAAALDMLLAELRETQPDSLHCYTAWQTARQALYGVNRETRDFARELRSIQVDPNHPEALADIADRLGILYEKFYRVAHEGAALVRERLVRLRDAPRDGQNVRRLQSVLRLREEEWSVGLGESDEEREERLGAIATETLRDLGFFERLVADTGPGSWREGVRAISLALVELTERIHAAIALRLQQTQAIEALVRHARRLAEGGDPDVQSTRQWLWNASGAFHAGLWVQGLPTTDERIVLERWLENKGGSPLPLVDDETWLRSFQPRKKAAPPPPPPALITDDAWDPGDDPSIREGESARAALVARLIEAGSVANLKELRSFRELRILVQLLWLPRDSAPLRRLGLKIAPPAARSAPRGTLRGPTFELDLENYRFIATTNKAKLDPSLEQQNEQLQTLPPEAAPRPTRARVPDVAASAIVPPVAGAVAGASQSIAPPTPPPAPDVAQQPAKPQPRRSWAFPGGPRRTTGGTTPMQKPPQE